MIKRLGDIPREIVAALEDQDWHSEILIKFHVFEIHGIEWNWRVTPDFKGWEWIQVYTPESSDGMRGESTHMEQVWVERPAWGAWRNGNNIWGTIVENSGFGMPDPHPVDFPSCPVDFFQEVYLKNKLLADKWESEREQREFEISQRETWQKNQILLEKALKELVHPLAGIELIYYRKGVEVPGVDLYVGVKKGSMYWDSCLVVEFEDRFFAPASWDWEAWLKENLEALKVKIAPQIQKFEEEEEEYKQYQAQKALETVLKKKEIAELRELLKAKKARSKSPKPVKVEPKEVARLRELCQKYPNIY